MTSSPAAYETLPPIDTPVWRYLSLVKLLALLRTRSLFMSRADLLDDPFEGSFTQGSLQAYIARWGDSASNYVQTVSRWATQHSFLSCWHLSEAESVALWNLYGPSDGAVAIRSTVRALQATFPEMGQPGESVLLNQGIRVVQYIDYKTEHPEINDLMGPLCYKRQPFSFEREIRAIRQELPTGPARTRTNGALRISERPDKVGIQHPVDLAVLISEVRVAPTSPPWMRETIEAALLAFECTTIPCRQSVLDELPDFRPVGA